MGKMALTLAAALFALSFTGTAKAADWCGPSYGYSSGYSTPGYGYSSPSYRTYSPGHTDYVPGHYQRHGFHYDYVPPHVDYHIGNRRYEVIRDPYHPGGGYIAPRRHRD